MTVLERLEAAESDLHEALQALWCERTADNAHAAQKAAQRLANLLADVRGSLS